MDLENLGSCEHFYISLPKFFIHFVIVIKVTKPIIPNDSKEEKKLHQENSVCEESRCKGNSKKDFKMNVQKFNNQGFQLKWSSCTWCENFLQRINFVHRQI